MNYVSGCSCSRPGTENPRRNKEKDSVDAVETTAKRVAKQSEECLSCIALYWRSWSHICVCFLAGHCSGFTRVQPVVCCQNRRTSQTHMVRFWSTIRILHYAEIYFVARPTVAGWNSFVYTSLFPVLLRQNTESTSVVAMKTSAESTAKQVEERLSCNLWQLFRHKCLVLPLWFSLSVVFSPNHQYIRIAVSFFCVTYIFLCVLCIYIII